MKLSRIAVAALLSLGSASVVLATDNSAAEQNMAKKASPRKMKRLATPESSLPSHDANSASVQGSTQDGLSGAASSGDDLADPDGSLRDTRTLGDGPSGF